MSRTLTPLAIVLALSLVAFADEVDDFLDVARASLTSAHPIGAYYEGVLGLPDFDFDEADMQRVVAGVNDVAIGAVGQSFDSITRLTKTGTRLRVERDAQVTIHNDDGYTRMDTRVTVDVEVRSNGDVLVDSIDGIRAGRSKRMLFRLRKVLYTFEDGVPVAKATLGSWPFQRTVTLKVELPAPTSGLAGSLPSSP